jgi:hypothetical protein
MFRFLLLAEAVAPAEPDKTLAAIATAVAAIIVALVRSFAKERHQLITKLVEAAYWATAEVAIRTPNTIDDKAAYALGVLHKMLAAEGASSLTRREEERAELQWQAMHGVEKVQQKLAAIGSPPRVVPS